MEVPAPAIVQDAAKAFDDRVHALDRVVVQPC